jgi:tetratricopeptide (TPR) repeat protein
MEALLSQASPEDPQVKSLLARVRFEEGDYAGAVALFDELGARGDGSWAALARATLAETKGYESRESAHFVFRYRPGKDAALAPYALETLEKEHDALATDLGYSPPGKVRVEVLDDARALSRVSTLTLEAIKTSGTIAICKFNRLMVTSPKALVRGYGWLDTLAHEYVHLVVSKKSLNEVPIWIHEGLAKFLESRWRGAPGQALSPPSAGLLAEAVKRNRLIPFERMHPSMALLPSQEDASLAFAEVFTAVEYMHQKGGPALLAALVERLRAKDSPEVAVGKVMGVSFARFQADWKAHLGRREYPRETVSLSAEKLRFMEDEGRTAETRKKKAKGAPEDDEGLAFGDFLEIDDLETRKLAHLGELMRARGRATAAVDEFSRAHSRAGNRYPSLSNRYAESLARTGDLTRAEQVLVGSLKPYPGYPRTHQNLGDLFLSTSRPREAERAFLEVIAVDPFDPRPHAGLIQIYKASGERGKHDREVAVMKLLSTGKGSPLSALGTLTVRSHPYARISVDGKDSGLTTPATLELAPGRHVLRLVNDERGLAEERVVELGPGEERGVDVTFEDESGEDPR